MTDRELLRLHLEAGWDITLPALDETAHELTLTQPLPPWSLYLGAFANEQVALWRPDVLPERRVVLLQHARQADVVWEQALGMRCEVVFRAPLISTQQLARAQQVARLLSADDVDLITAFEADSALYFLDPRKAPCIGVVVAGRLVSIAHSSRQTPFACALGINTLPEARGRGYAAAATTVWTAIVQRQGQEPLYSAFAWNTASLRLAQSVGYLPRINGVYGPVPARDVSASDA